MLPLEILAGVVGLGAVGFALSARVVKQYERGVVFRLGSGAARARHRGSPGSSRSWTACRKVNMQIVTMPVPAQDGHHPGQRHGAGGRGRLLPGGRPGRGRSSRCRTTSSRSSQVAQTSLRSIIGKSDLDDLLSNREQLNQGLELMIDSPALGWGVHIDRVEIKDVALPESMKRSMSRQAEAERERRARVITADGELQASKKLSAGRRGDGRHPGRAAAAAAADGRRGGRGEELDAGAAVPGRAAAVPGRPVPRRLRARSPPRARGAGACDPRPRGQRT